MKKIHKIAAFVAIVILSGCFLSSCDDKDEYVISPPVIETAEISSTTFLFGETLHLTVRVADANARLATLDVSIIADNRTIAVQTVQLSENSSELDVPVFVPLVANLSDGAGVTIALSLKNVLKGEATRAITGLTGNRPHYNQLYLVTDGGGEVYPLTPQTGNNDRYQAQGLTLNRSFSYTIAEKVTDGQIDYSGLVWGSSNGKIALIDERGESAFAFAAGADYTESFVFDNYAFTATLSGSTLGSNDLVLADFADETIDGELFGTLSRSLEKGQELALFKEMADEEIVYNPDFFERLAPDKVKFLGETGTYTLYYNTVRKHLLVGVENPAYPDYLLITGGGIGYPTKVKGIDKEHAWWGFGNIRNFILLRKTAENVFQGTIFIHAKDDSWVGFKLYENAEWGGEKGFAGFTVTGEQLLEGTDDGNWHPTADLDADAFYRLTVNWADNTVNVEKIIL